jgi:hypothetical protein
MCGFSFYKHNFNIQKLSNLHGSELHKSVNTWIHKYLFSFISFKLFSYFNFYNPQYQIYRIYIIHYNMVWYDTSLSYILFAFNYMHGISTEMNVYVKKYTIFKHCGT